MQQTGDYFVRSFPQFLICTLNILILLERHLHPPLVPVVMLKTKESSVEVAVLRWAERSQEWRLRGSVTKARRNAWHKDTSAPSRLPDCWRINRLRCKLFLCDVKLRRGLRSFCSC